MYNTVGENKISDVHRSHDGMRTSFIIKINDCYLGFLFSSSSVKGQVIYRPWVSFSFSKILSHISKDYPVL